jgi:hypothetical protein
MLQKYKFIDGLQVNNLQLEVSLFIKNIRKVKATDNFDPDKYFPTSLANKVKAKVKNKKGVLVEGPLFNKAKAFFDKYKSLGIHKENVYRAFLEMNKINGLFGGSVSRVTINDLPNQIQDEAKSLFVHLYEETLSSYGIKHHYEDFSKLLGNNWCPFCGMEQLVHYTHQKEDYDHLLAKTIYPFSAVNMRNLAPMGKTCNRTHKKKKDLIWDDKRQVKAVNPYNGKIEIKIDFSGTVLPTQGRKNGNWKITLSPKRDEVTRWDIVFNITDRITKDFLTNGKKPEYEVWLSDYINMQIDENVKFGTIKQTRDSIARYGARFDSNRYRSFRYIQADLFKWMAVNASDSFIKSLMNVINKKKIRP